MSDNHPFLTFVLVGGVVFCSYNVILNLRRASNFDAAVFHEARDSIESKLGTKLYDYTCVVGQPSPLEQIDAFCQQEAVATVSQYQSCYISKLCPAVVLVAYDKNDLLIYKFRQ